MFIAKNIFSIMVNNFFYFFLFLVTGFLLCWMIFAPITTITFNSFNFKTSYSFKISIEVGTLNIGFGRITRHNLDNKFEVIWLFPFLSVIVHYS